MKFSVFIAGIFLINLVSSKRYLIEVDGNNNEEEGSDYQSTRCRGSNYPGGGSCCTSRNPCGEGEGDCDRHGDCKEGLLCGRNNCKKFGHYYQASDDCCEKKPASHGQKCWGSGYVGGKSCCTEDSPCGEGEGDCDINRDCKSGLKCGINNCKKFGAYYNKYDDCCEMMMTAHPGDTNNAMELSSTAVRPIPGPGNGGVP